MYRECPLYNFVLTPYSSYNLWVVNVAAAGELLFMLRD